MSVSYRDHMPPPGVKFPHMLALQIVRKAATLAADFEEKTLTQMTNDARNALEAGEHPQEIARAMGL